MLQPAKDTNAFLEDLLLAYIELLLLRFLHSLLMSVLKN